MRGEIFLSRGAGSTRGPWLAQWVKHGTQSQVVNSSPTVGRREYLKIRIF